LIQKYLAGSLQVEHLRIPIAGLPPHLAGTKLVQLSDFHYDGLRLSDGLLKQAIATANSLEPDLIFLTGDYITDDPRPITGLAKHLAHLKPKVGVYAVLGNHDLRWRGAREKVQHSLESAKVCVLWNEVCFPMGDGLAVVGLADYWSEEFQPDLVFAQLDPDIPRLVLSHNPDTAAVMTHWRIDLQLSGHTHGGQVVLPSIGPVIGKLHQWRKQYLPAWHKRCEKIVEHWEWSAGLYQVGKNWLYTNRGLGTYFPGRLFCPPELTVFTLEVAPHKPATPVPLTL
jgi:predicted MPP superfamily phosphohydrolase